jgi:hypothetical protein
VVRNVRIENLKSKKSNYALYLRGFENAPITDVQLIDCDFEGVSKGNLVENVKDFTVRNTLLNGKPMERVG